MGMLLYTVQYIYYIPTDNEIIFSVTFYLQLFQFADKYPTDRDGPTIGIKEESIDIENCESKTKTFYLKLNTHTYTQRHTHTKDYR